MYVLRSLPTPIRSILDGMNDIPMLKIAGVAAVMDNAYEEVKKYADYIAPSNDESGVADIIKRFILNA